MIKIEIRSNNILALIRPKTIFNLKIQPVLVSIQSTTCMVGSYVYMVFYFAVSVFPGLVMSKRFFYYVVHRYTAEQILLNFSNQCNFDFSLSNIHYHTLKQRKIKIELACL